MYLERPRPLFIVLWVFAAFIGFLAVKIPDNGILNQWMYRRGPNPFVVFIMGVGFVLLLTAASGALGTFLAYLTTLVK